MVFVVVCGLLFFAFVIVNWNVRRTNAYKNFYRAIHVVKDVSPTNKYDYGAFGSTFAYYAYDLKGFNGHNFSIEPQSVAYMKKTIDNFICNVEKGGVALISLAGCFFAASSTNADEACTTYYSFLKPAEFNHFRMAVKIKYYLKRYFPALSPVYIKRLIKDEPLKYSKKNGISYEKGVEEAKRRIRGWERVVGKAISEKFESDAALDAVLDGNIELMRKIIYTVREYGVVPVFVVLPMSKAFNDCCPRVFYEKILYRCLNKLENENVLVLDYLYDEDLCLMDNYLTSDCLNVNGRKKLTNRIIKDLNDSLVTKAS